MPLSSWYHSFVVALTLTSPWVLLEGNRTSLPCDRTSLSSGLGSNAEAMAPLTESSWSPGDTNPLLTAGPPHYSLRFNIIQLCKPSSAQLSSLFLVPGYQPVFTSPSFFEINLGVPFSIILKPPIMSFSLATDHSGGGPSYFNFGSILPPWLSLLPPSLGERTRLRLLVG